MWDDQALLDCTLDIDDELIAAIRASRTAAGVDIEAAREAQAKAEAQVGQPLTLELLDRLFGSEGDDFDRARDDLNAIKEAYEKAYDEAGVRPHQERFRAAAEWLIRERCDLVEKLAARYRAAKPTLEGMPETAYLGMWMASHQDALDRV